MQKYGRYLKAVLKIIDFQYTSIYYGSEIEIGGIFQKKGHAH